MKSIKYLLIVAFICFIVACYLMTTNISPILSVAIGVLAMCFVGIASHIYEQDISDRYRSTNHSVNKHGMIEGFR
jgi:hypothetical protein